MIGTKIEWATDTVNFWHGCTKVSEACQFCYAERQSRRFHRGSDGSALLWGNDGQRLLRVPQALEELGKIRRRDIKGRLRCMECGADLGTPRRLVTTTGLQCECGGAVEFNRERPRVFVNSMSDFFEDRRDLDAPRLGALDAMRKAPEIDFLLLTKRPEKIRDLLWRAYNAIQAALACEVRPPAPVPLKHWIFDWMENGNAPSNIWLGTTIENQEAADQRIPELLKVPAAVRFLSCEPLLGPVRLDQCAPYILEGDESNPGVLNAFTAECHHPATCRIRPGVKGTSDGIHWVIVGGESGPNARPMHPDSARSLRDQCAAAGVPFFFKQHGEWAPVHFDNESEGVHLPGGQWIKFDEDGSTRYEFHLWHEGWNDPLKTFTGSLRVGKKAAGRLLDGQEHNAFPEPR